MQVQFQVASDAAFGTVVFNQTLTGQVTGPVSTSVSPALTDGNFYRWRARAGNADGTTWGPWSDVWILRPLLSAGRAVGYSYENTGPLATLYQGVAEYSMENTGAQAVLVPHIREYVTENVGFEVTIKPHAVDYVYEGDVSTNPPKPHLWFLWRPLGFAGDEVWAYGRGFGEPQSQFSGQLKIDPGPDYTTTDISPTVEDWYLAPPGDHAWDDQRVIYPGSTTADVNVTQEVEVIRFVMPSSIVPSVEAASHRVYVSTNQATSNKVGWLMYPTIPVAAAIAESGLGSYSYARLAALATPSGDLEQRLLSFDLPEYMIVRGRAQRMPLLTASCATSATLGTWSTTEALEDATAVALGATRRWLPDAAHVVAHPELGTGVSLWTPSVGDTSMAWRFDAGSTPVIDPAYVVETRLGTKTVPAMTFDGSMWGELTANLPVRATFTVAMVAVLGPQEGGRGYLLSTFVDGAPDVGSTAASLQLTSARLEYYTGGRLATADLQQSQRRPVIILLSSSGRWGELQVIDLQPSRTVFNHAPQSSTNSKLWLGRADQVGTLMKPATMDVLDLAYWDHQLTVDQAQAVVTQLDGIYGVTG